MSTRTARPYRLRWVIVLACWVGTGGWLRMSAAVDETPTVERASAAEKDRDSAAQVQATGQAPDQPPGHHRMLAVLAELARKEGPHNRFFGLQPLLEARQKLESLPENAPLTDRFKLKARLAQLELQLGYESRALELFEEVDAHLAELGAQVSEEWALDALIHCGIAHLRYAETQNCCNRFTPDSCLLPIRGQGIHTDVTGSNRAAQYFERVLARSRSTSKVHLEAIWLLNVARMTLGEYPDGVPEEYRLPPERFVSKIPFTRFRNLAKPLGVNEFSMSGSVIAEDFDNDGLIDLLVGPYDMEGQLKLHRNLGNGRFADVTVAAGLQGMPGGLNMMQTDYNNDGFADVLVLRGAWWDDHGFIPNSLLKNNGNGTFTDVTFEAGLGKTAYPTQAAAWADYDLDGDLDLYIGNELVSEKPLPSELYRNNGDGTFTDVADEAGVRNRRFAKGVAFGDVDNDGDPDLLVSNLYASNRLYMNNGDRTFTDRAHDAGVEEPQVSFPCWLWDYNNDNRLDIFVGSFSGYIDRIALYYLYGFSGVGQSCIYRAEPGLKFTDQTNALGLLEPGAVMGCNFGDVNNDGWLDFCLGTGAPPYGQLMPNKLYISVNGERFEDVSVPAGMSNLQKGHGVAMADLDRDGDLDIFHQLGGAYPGDKYVDALYENPGFKNDWISLKLVGREANRAAIGAKIRVYLADTDGPRMVCRTVGSGGSFGASPLEQTIGLGKPGRIERVEIEWPRRNSKPQVLSGLELNRAYLIEEDQPAQLRTRQSFQLDDGEDDSSEHAAQRTTTDPAAS